MGYKTTYDIDRETAIQVIMSKVWQKSNKELEDILEEFDESGLRNFIVHHELPDDSESYRIENMGQF